MARKRIARISGVMAMGSKDEELLAAGKFRNGTTFHSLGDLVAAVEKDNLVIIKLFIEWPTLVTF
jgi:hypothetical protein